MTTVPALPPSRALLIIVLVVITIAIAVVLTGGSSPATGTRSGTLTGNVSIGPLCPVEPCTISRDRLIAAYAARPISISTTEGTVVASVTADPGTGYTVALRPGTYVIDIPRRGIGGSHELPATVTIREGATVRLNISIDTGIR